MSDILRVEEAAEHLRISPWKLRKMCRQNEIPYFRIGSLLMFRRPSLDRWVQEQEDKGDEWLQRRSKAIPNKD